MNCYEAIDVMGDAVEGHLGSAFQAGFDEHMAECRPCRTYFEQLGVTRRALRRLARKSDRNPSAELRGLYRAHFPREDESEDST
jgi:predicted anti-sigma-YlaC factor YlaD